MRQPRRLAGLSLCIGLSCKYIRHGLSCFFLCRGGDVSVGIQSEPGGEVAEHTGDSLDVHAVLEGDGCEGVAEVMESYLRDACPLQYPLQHIVHTVRGDGTAVGRREHIGVIGLSLLLPQDFDCLGRDADCPVQSNEGDPEEISEGFRELEEFLCSLPLEDNDAVFTLCCNLCSIYQRMAFMDGLQYGARLMQEIM